MLSSCRKYERECHNGCGATFALPAAAGADEAATPEAHYRDQCPLEPIPCIFAKVGEVSQSRLVTWNTSQLVVADGFFGVCNLWSQFGCTARVTRSQQTAHQAEVGKVPHHSGLSVQITGSVTEEGGGCTGLMHAGVGGSISMGYGGVLQDAAAHEALCSATVSRLQDEIREKMRVSSSRVRSTPSHAGTQHSPEPDLVCCAVSMCSCCQRVRRRSGTASGGPT